MQIGFETHEYFCIRCATIREVKMPDYWEPSPFLSGEKCEECGKTTYAYSPPATYYNE